MKFLKKTFAYILPAMMVLGGATACTDFIEIDPENKVPEQGVDFTNKNNMYQPVVVPTPKYAHRACSGATHY